jgi:hypothetical protein
VPNGIIMTRPRQNLHTLAVKIGAELGKVVLLLDLNVIKSGARDTHLHLLDLGFGELDPWGLGPNSLNLGVVG